MTPADIVVAILVGAAFLFFLRLATAKGRSVEIEPHSPTPDYEPDTFETVTSDERSAIPAVGREIPLPFDIAEIAGDPTPSDFPRLLNYWFGNTRLETGPPNKAEFFDELHIEFFNVSEGHKWTAHYIIATPAGISKHMQEKGLKYLPGTDLIIVPEYNLAEILRVMVQRQCAAWLDPENTGEEEKFVDFPD